MERNDGMLGLGKLQVLLLLGKEDLSGYDIMQKAAALSGKRPSAGQIYPLLTKLKGLGYLNIGSTGARKKKIYKLTPKGREALLEMSERANGIIEAMLANKLVKCEYCGCVVYENAYEKQIKGKTHYYCCKSCAAESRNACCK